MRYRTRCRFGLEPGTAYFTELEDVQRFCKNRDGAYPACAPHLIVEYPDGD